MGDAKWFKNVPFMGNMRTSDVPSTGFALSLWQHLPRNQILVLPIPMGKGGRVVSGLLSPPLVPLFGVPKRDPSKNREMDGALTFGGRALMEKTTIN